MPREYANLKAHIIQAVLNGYFRFKTFEQAKLQLNIIAQKFAASHYELHKPTPESITLWIRQYGLTDVERKQGLLGHFARISVAKDKGGYTLKADIIRDDAPHPQKRRIAMQHPNWGHPILRSVEKKKAYATIAEAEAELTALQLEYPQVSVPGEHCLFIAVYGRVDDKKGSRVKRYVLEIEARKEGGFIIAAKEKKPKPKLPKALAPKKTVVKKAPEPKEPPKEPIGYFTSKVALKKKKKPGPKGE